MGASPGCFWMFTLRLLPTRTFRTYLQSAVNAKTLYIPAAFRINTFTTSPNYKMPPKKAATNGKRKASSPPEPAAKKSKISNDSSDPLPRPIELLNNALKETKADREKINVKDAVVHWFKCDLRTKDNKSLHLASEKAKEKGVPLIAIYIVSPRDFQAHLTAPVRVDFILRTLEVMK